MGRIEHIHVVAEAGGQMIPLASARARAGVGLVGDRYAAGLGYWRDARVSRDVTLVEAEVIDELANRDGLVLAPGELRRNVTTRDVRLNDLVGHVFWLGGVVCRGTELCEPCRHLEEITGKELLRPLVHRGGLRAKLLTSGSIHVGDPIEGAAELDGVGVLVIRDGTVLMGQRLSSHGYGTWSLPGGKPSRGESALECALRELREETGLEAFEPRIVYETIDGFPESRLVFRTRFVRVEGAIGEPQVLEPDKTAHWRWLPWSDLPTPLFAPVSSLVTSGYDPRATAVGGA